VQCWPEHAADGRLVRLTLAPPCDRQIGLERYGLDDDGHPITNLPESIVPAPVALAAWVELDAAGGDRPVRH
jgi:hypothetical protein